MSRAHKLPDRQQFPFIPNARWDKPKLWMEFVAPQVSSIQTVHRYQSFTESHALLGERTFASLPKIYAHYWTCVEGICHTLSRISHWSLAVSTPFLLLDLNSCSICFSICIMTSQCGTEDCSHWLEMCEQSRTSCAGTLSRTHRRGFQHHDFNKLATF